MTTPTPPSAMAEARKLLCICTQVGGHVYPCPAGNEIHVSRVARALSELDERLKEPTRTDSEHRRRCGCTDAQHSLDWTNWKLIQVEAQLRERDGYHALYMEYVERVQGLEFQLERVQAQLREREREVARYMMANNRQAEEVERLREALEQIIFASDQCRGHADCAHSMQPWQDARALLIRRPAPEGK